MNHNPTIQERLQALSPKNIFVYSTAQGWEEVYVTDKGLSILENPKYPSKQLHLTRHEHDPWIVEMMWEVVRRLSDVEERSMEQIVEDLQHTEADVLRVRVNTLGAKDGQIPWVQDLEIRDGIKRALAAAARAVVQPAAFYPRLSSAEGDEMLASCRAGQTERGSYVLKVVCPLYGRKGEAYDLDEPPFVRRVTGGLMESLRGIVESIEGERVESYLEQAPAASRVNANLCDALLQILPEEDGGVEFSVRWAPSEPKGRAFEGVVGVKAQHRRMIAHMSQRLRPRGAPQAVDAWWVGTVEELLGVVGGDERRSGDVVLSLLDSESGEVLSARVALGAEEYAKATEAHAKGRAYVKLRGHLSRKPRVSRVENPQDFQLI